MRKLLSLFALAGVALLLGACSSDDDTPVVVKEEPELIGKWSLVNDADPTLVTTLELFFMS